MKRYFSRITISLKFIFLALFINWVLVQTSLGCHGPLFPDVKEIENLMEEWKKVQEKVAGIQDDLLAEKVNLKKELYWQRLNLLRNKKVMILQLNKEMNSSKNGSVGAQKRVIRALQNSVLYDLKRIDLSSMTGKEDIQLAARKKRIDHILHRLVRERKILNEMLKVANKDETPYYLKLHLKLGPTESEEEPYFFGQRPILIENNDNLDEDLQALKKDILLLEQNVERDFKAVYLEMESDLKKGETAINDMIRMIISAPLSP